MPQLYATVRYTLVPCSFQLTMQAVTPKSIVESWKVVNGKYFLVT